MIFVAYNPLTVISLSVTNYDMNGFFSSFSPFLKKYWLETAFLSIAAIITCVSLTILMKTSGLKEDNEIIVEKKETSLKTSQKIMIDVAGAVEKPGVYEVTSGARLKDVLNLSDGLTEEADSSFFNRNFNLARYVNDQEKIYVPSISEIAAGLFAETPQTLNYTSPVNTSIRSQGETLQGETLRVNLNTASLDELDQLPGIGQITAQKIVANRPYKSADELFTKKVVNKGVFEKIKGLIAP